ncbi:hypothetical protein J1605_004479 [Eschrichtius robustus]|uniref:Prothymosin alpha n=1 Tax=Eschrichtius robustus TaxID=9764 RepID=A0AB34HHN0_ESCRO|nr:hypothetical protein J1605_004479 [Eschrichtius robustus]
MSDTAMDTSSEIITKDLKEKKEVVEEVESGRESKHDYLGEERPPCCPLRAESPAGDACSPAPNQTHNGNLQQEKKETQIF